MSRRENPTIKDYYKILELASDCGSEEIKESYRRLIRLCHEDSTTKVKDTENNSAEINEAYKILNNPDSRRDYDRQRAKPVLVGSIPEIVAGGNNSSIVLLRDCSLLDETLATSPSVEELLEGAAKNESLALGMLDDPRFREKLGERILTLGEYHESCAVKILERDEILNSSSCQTNFFRRFLEKFPSLFNLMLEKSKKYSSLAQSIKDYQREPTRLKKRIALIEACLPKEPMRALELMKEYPLDLHELKNLGIKNIKLAELMIADASIVQCLEYNIFYLGLEFELIAHKIFDDPKLWMAHAYQGHLTADIALKHQSIFIKIINRPEIYKYLFTNYTMKLYEKYQAIWSLHVDQNNPLNNVVTVKPFSADVSEEVNFETLSVQQTIEACKKSVEIARKVVHDPKTKPLEKIDMLGIACLYEELALEILNNPSLLEKFGWSTSTIFEMATKFKAAFIKIVQNPEAYRAIVENAKKYSWSLTPMLELFKQYYAIWNTVVPNEHPFNELLADIPDKTFALAIEKLEIFVVIAQNPTLHKKYSIEQVIILRPKFRYDVWAKYIDAEHLFKKLLKQDLEFKNLENGKPFDFAVIKDLIATTPSPLRIYQPARANLAYARQLLEIFDQLPQKEVVVESVCSHPVLALQLISEEKYYEYLQPVVIATSDREVCLRVLAIPRLASQFTGAQIFSLYQKYGPDVLAAIEQQDDLKGRFLAHVKVSEFLSNQAMTTSYGMVQNSTNDGEFEYTAAMTILKKDATGESLNRAISYLIKASRLQNSFATDKLLNLLQERKSTPYELIKFCVDLPEFATTKLTFERLQHFIEVAIAANDLPLATKIINHTLLIMREQMTAFAMKLAVRSEIACRLILGIAEISEQFSIKFLDRLVKTFPSQEALQVIAENSILAEKLKFLSFFKKVEDRNWLNNYIQQLPLNEVTEYATKQQYILMMEDPEFRLAIARYFVAKHNEHAATLYPLAVQHENVANVIFNQPALHDHIDREKLFNLLLAHPQNVMNPVLTFPKWQEYFKEYFIEKGKNFANKWLSNCAENINVNLELAQVILYALNFSSQYLDLKQEDSVLKLIAIYFSLSKPVSIDQQQHTAKTVIQIIKSENCLPLSLSAINTSCLLLTFLLSKTKRLLISEYAPSFEEGHLRDLLKTHESLFGSNGLSDHLKEKIPKVDGPIISTDNSNNTIFGSITNDGL